jgi:hypothetical protein
MVHVALHDGINDNDASHYHSCTNPCTITSTASLKIHTHKLICDLHIAANKGIGFEITRLLAEAGLTVIMTSRSGG